MSRLFLSRNTELQTPGQAWECEVCVAQAVRREADPWSAPTGRRLSRGERVAVVEDWAPHCLRSVGGERRFADSSRGDDGVQGFRAWACVAGLCLGSRAVLAEAEGAADHVPGCCYAF
jgi:hypothetical protein